MIWDLLSVFQDFQVHFIDLFRKLDQLEILKDIQFSLRDIGGMAHRMGLGFARPENIRGFILDDAQGLNLIVTMKMIIYLHRF